MGSLTKILGVSSFTFGTYTVDKKRSIVTFTYHVEFRFGIRKTFTDRLFFKDVAPALWDKIPKAVLEPTLQALLLMLGINYWLAFPTSNMHIEGFALTRAQAKFWDTLYLHGLGEFFFSTKLDFRNLIRFPYDDAAVAPTPTKFKRPSRALLLNGAGKDSILSAEMLKESGTLFDFFAFSPTPAHKRVANLVGAKTVTVNRRIDPWMIVSGAYPSVSTYTFIAVLLAELLGYNSIVFSNERSADFGNLTYLGLEVNHQWCKSSEAEKLVNDYIQSFITPDISTQSLLREYSELEIVRRFVRYPQYFKDFTSCNIYFWQPRFIQLLARRSYWCKNCAKCAFLFACFSAFLPKKEMIAIFGTNLYARRRLLPLYRRMLGTEGFKPLDCVGEPEETILAMHYSSLRKEYAGTPAMKVFEKHFPSTYDFDKLEESVLPSNFKNKNSARLLYN